jgi:hypothetical protein
MNNKRKKNKKIKKKETSSSVALAINPVLNGHLWLVLPQRTA